MSVVQLSAGSGVAGIFHLVTRGGFGWRDFPGPDVLSCADHQHSVRPVVSTGDAGQRAAGVEVVGELAVLTHDVEASLGAGNQPLPVFGAQQSCGGDEADLAGKRPRRERIAPLRPRFRSESQSESAAIGTVGDAAVRRSSV